VEDHKWATKRTEGWSDQRLHRRAKRKASTKKNGMRRTRCTPTPRSTKVIGTSTSTSNTMNHTTRITDWTCGRSDRRRAARRDVRFYHVGVPQLKKKFIFITLTTLFSKKNIKFKVALRPRLGLKPMVISVSNHGRRVVKSGTPSSTPCVSAVTSLVHSKHLTW